MSKTNDYMQQLRDKKATSMERLLHDLSAMRSGADYICQTIQGDAGRPFIRTYAAKECLDKTNNIRGREGAMK